MCVSRKDLKILSLDCVNHTFPERCEKRYTNTYTQQNTHKKRTSRVPRKNHVLSLKKDQMALHYYPAAVEYMQVTSKHPPSTSHLPKSRPLQLQGMWRYETAVLLRLSQEITYSYPPLWSCLWTPLRFQSKSISPNCWSNRDNASDR